MVKKAYIATSGSGVTSRKWPSLYAGFNRSKLIKFKYSVNLIEVKKKKHDDV